MVAILNNTTQCTEGLLQNQEWTEYALENFFVARKTRMKPFFSIPKWTLQYS